MNISKQRTGHDREDISSNGREEDVLPDSGRGREDVLRPQEPISGPFSDGRGPRGEVSVGREVGDTCSGRSSSVGRAVSSPSSVDEYNCEDFNRDVESLIETALRVKTERDDLLAALKEMLFIYSDQERGYDYFLGKHIPTVLADAKAAVEKAVSHV